MMKIKTMLRQLLRSPQKFPVEAFMGLAFFVTAALHTANATWDSSVGQRVSNVNSDILWFFVPLLVLTFWLHKVNRWAYVASGLLFLPLMCLNLKPFLWTYGFFFTYVLAAILLLVGTRWLDNRSFAAHCLHVVTQLFFGVVIAGLLTGAVMVIVASFYYIFGIREPDHLYEYIWQFIWFVIAPQVCCTLIRQDEDEVQEPARVLQLILNFILSPAVIIYTVILYAYFIKIAFEWDLPKGGVAWLVMGFVTVALVGSLMQHILSRRYYDWFYDHFTWIAIPPLIMFWIGSLYRIRLYSFTESRFYLLVAGVLMTLFVLMLLWRRSRRFQLMALIFGGAIILFTYVPGISAKRIGLRCQTERLEQLIQDLNLVNAKTGKLVRYVNKQKICADSVLCEQYRQACSVISYVRQGMGRDKFDKKYGKWAYNEYQFWYDKADGKTDEPAQLVEAVLEEPIDLGGYHILIPNDTYETVCKDGVVTVVMSGKTVLRYPVDSLIKSRPQLLDQPEQLLIWRNDSLLMVLRSSSIGHDDEGVHHMSTYNAMMFRK